MNWASEWALSGCGLNVSSQTWSDVLGATIAIVGALVIVELAV